MCLLSMKRFLYFINQGSFNSLAFLSGILALGFGGSAVRKRKKLVCNLFIILLGCYYWLDIKKTIGTIAFVIAIMGYAIWTIFMAAFFKAESASIIAGTSTSSSCIKYTLAILRTDKKEKDSRIIVLHLSGLVEVISGQNNKIILPMHMYSLTILTQFDT